MAMDPHYDTMLEWALHYARADFLVFPVHADKSPLASNGFYDGTTSVERITDWWTRWPNALLGCRVPTDVVILDIDPRHHGDDVWRALQNEHGQVVTGREHRSGRGDGGRQLWFRRPEAQLSIKPLTEWAKARKVGEAVGQNGWTCGIDILHHTQRYTILPPSPHPATGRPYVWHSKAKPAPMPSWLSQLITKPTATPAAPRVGLRIADSDSIADWYSARHTWNEILGPAGWELVSGGGDEDGSKWRHPNASAATSSSIKHGCLFVYTPNTEFEPTDEGDRHGYTRFRAWAVLEHGGDLSAAARAAFAMRDGVGGPRAAGVTPPPNVDPTTGEIISPTDDRALGDEFWNARPHLAHIRQAALSRMVAPAAVLATVLARVAAFTPPSTRIPPIVGTDSPLSTYVALLAKSGGGKSSSVGCAAELLPDVPPGCVGPLPLGSGEGLIDAYFEMVEDVDGAGKKTKVKKQTKRGALFLLDEGEALSDMANRKGNATMPIIRTAWSGADTGQANASVETKRHLRAGQYAIGLVSLWQPQVASKLLDDAPGGTPQRFVFFDTHDTDISIHPPAWPGPLPWSPPAAIVMGGTHQRHYLDIDPAIELEVRTEHVAIQRGDAEVHPLDGHARLVRLKLAGLLAVLDGRHDINGEDWSLAGTIMRHSNSVRSWIVDEARRAREAGELAGARRQAAAQSVIEDTMATRSLHRAAKAVWRVADRAKPEPISRRQAHAAVASRDRQHVSIDDAIAEAVRLDWVVPNGPDAWRVGTSRPS